MPLRRKPARMLDQSGATGGQGLVWDATSHLWLPGNVVRSVVAGTNVTVDSTDPLHPVISSAGGGGGSTALDTAYPFISGTYYTDPNVNVSGSTTTSPVAGRLEFKPFPVAHSTAFDQLAVDCVGSGTSKYRIGIYDSDPSTGLPRNVVAGGGQVDAAATGLRTLTISVTLATGLYWLAWLADVVGTGTYLSWTTPTISGRLGWTTPVGGASDTELIAFGVAAGALPSPAPSVAPNANNSTLRVFARAL